MGKPRKTNEQFLLELSVVDSTIVPLEMYSGATNRIRVQCQVCGKQWNPKAYSLLQGKGCPHCSALRGAKVGCGLTAAKDHGTFIRQLHALDPTILVLDTYQNTHTNIAVECKTCHHRWSVKPYSLLQGHGCPRCAKSGTSFTEQFLLSCFRVVLGQGEVLSRDRQLIGMELDIVIPKLKFAVEPGDWLLHKRSLQRDAEKRRRCAEQGIRLLTVYDKCTVGTQPPFDEDCLLYFESLNSGNHSTLKKLVQDLLTILGIQHSFSDDEWMSISKEARANSRARSQDEFVNELKLVHPRIEVVDRFNTVNDRLKVRCLECGHVWDAVPANLLSGNGCRVCGTRRAHVKLIKPQDVFEDQVRAANPDIEVIGDYRGRHSPVAARCRICGLEWQPIAASLLRGSNHKGWKGIHKHMGLL